MGSLSYLCCLSYLFCVVGRSECMTLTCGIDEVIKVVEPLEIEYSGDTNQHCRWTFKGYGPLKLFFSEMRLDGKDDDTCYDYVIADGYKLCTMVLHDGVLQDEDLVLEFFSDDYDESGNPGFTATVENQCRRFEERCDFEPEGDLSSESVLVYTISPDTSADLNLTLSDHDNQILSGQLLLEMVMFNSSLGKTVCQNCEIKSPSFEIPSCHASHLENICEWEFVENIYVSPGHQDLKGKVFLASGNFAEMQTKAQDLKLNKVCLYFEYYVRTYNDPVIKLMVENTNTGDKTTVYSNELHVTEGWYILQILEDLPLTYQMKDIRLILRLEDKGMIEVLVNKIYGCDGDSIRLDRVVLKNDSVIDQKLYPLGGPKFRIEGGCRNGGKWDGERCQCLAGFTGYECEVGCGPNKYGPVCEAECSQTGKQCRGMIFCKHRLGCHCGTGYMGAYCTENCSTDKYGADCRENCGNCQGNCNSFTGICEQGCKPGFKPPTCVMLYPYLLKPPRVRPYFTYAIIEVDATDDIIGKERVKYFQVQFKNESLEKWEKKELQAFSKNKNISYNLTGLVAGIDYEVRIILAEDEFDSYNDETVQVVKFSTNCNEYKLLNIDTQASHNYIFLSWENRSGNASVYECPIKEVLVQIMISFEWNDYHVNTNFLNITSLKPGKDYKIRLRPAYTDENKATRLIVSTLPYVSGRVNYLEARSIASTSAEIAWEAVKGTSPSQTFEVSYKCVRILAQSDKPCDSDSGSRKTSNEKIWVRGLLPHRKYKFRVQEYPGADFSQIFATTKPDLPNAPPILKNITTECRKATVTWKPPEDCSLCSGFLIGYQYKLLTSSGKRKAFTYTERDNVILEDLEPSTSYDMQIFLRNTVGWNDEVPLTLKIRTKPEESLQNIRHLSVYKQGKREVGLRWGVTLKSENTVFIIKVDGNEVYSGNVSFCRSWPTFYCFTVDGLQEDIHYNVSVGLQRDNSETWVMATTTESAPGSPWDLRVFNVTESSANLEWRPPIKINGILRNFVIKLGQIDGTDCCQEFPDFQFPVTDEKETYQVEVGSLKPESVYALKVMAMTTTTGPAAWMTATTRPPRPNLPPLPKLNRVVTWKDLETSVEEGKAEGPFALIVLCNFTYENNVRVPDLRQLLRETLDSGFYIAAEFEEGDTVTLGEGNDPQDGIWGKLLNPPLISDKNYTVAVASIASFNNLYNVAVRMSHPFTS